MNHLYFIAVLIRKLIDSRWKSFIFIFKNIYIIISQAMIRKNYCIVVSVICTKTVLIFFFPSDIF